MIGKQAQLVSVYCKKLDISPNATITELKEAFVQKARGVHPVKNDSEEARKEYKLLKKAYLYLLGIKTGKIPVEKTIKNLDTGFELNHHQARMFPFKNHKEKYKVIKKPSQEEEKDVGQITIVLSYISIVATFVMWPFWPIVVINTVGKNVIPVTCVFLVFTSPFIIMPWRSLKQKSKEAKKAALKRLSRSVLIYLLLGVLITIVGFVYFVSRTLLSTTELLFVFLFPFVVLFVLLPIAKKNYVNASRFICFVIWPLVFNLFFAVNFVYSKPYETRELSYNENQNDSIVVVLEGKEFQESMHIRSFFFRQHLLKHYSSIDFKISKGFFGFYVLKDFDFNKIRKNT